MFSLSRLTVVSLLVSLGSISPKVGLAQILNIDKPDTLAYSPKAKSSFNFSTGLEVDKQKNTLWDATNTGEWMLQKNKDLLILAGSYRFTYNGPDDILNTGFIHLRFRFGYRNRIQPESFLQYQWDNRRGLEYRSLAGWNLRYNIWKGDNWDFNAGLGLMYEEEKWNFSAVDSLKIPLLASPITNRLIKINAYIRLNWKTGDNSDLSLNIFLQARPTYFHPRIAPNFQWNIGTGKHIGFSVNFSGIYDDAPVVPIQQFYYSLSNSLLLRF